MKAEGIWECTVISANFGEDDKGSPQVQINVQITDTAAPEDTKGQRCTYDDQVNAKSALYVGRSCTAVGWRGGDLRTLKADVKAWVEATGGKSTVEIRHLEIKNGKKTGQIWDKVNSIGRSTARVLKEPTIERLDDANEAMRAALAALAADDAASAHVAGGSGAADDAASAHVAGGSGAADDDIPFATCALAADPSPIARVLR